MAHWFREDGRSLDLGEWRTTEHFEMALDDRDDRAEISKNRGLFNSISWGDKNAFICEMPGGKITFQP